MKNILIIDDDDILRKMLRRMLEEFGYSVTEAQNGKVGLKLYSQHPIDLVITDLFMPEREGLETILELKRIDPKVKIIAISGGGNQGDVSLLSVAEHFGALDTLVKPFDMKDLIQAVENALMKDVDSHLKL